MSVRNRLGTAIAILLVLALAGAAMFSMTDAGAQEAVAAGSNVTITVGATGTSSAPPDLAVVDVAVEASASSADAARSTVAESAAGMRDALAGVNVSDDQIRTTHFVTRTERDDETVTYRATHGFELRVPVDDAGSVVDTAVAGGATRVDGVRFTLAGETVRELRSDAIEEALLSARTDADVVASATGSEVTAVRSVQTTDGGVAPVLSEAGRGDGTTFEPGPVTVTAHVTVTYAAN